MILLVNAANRAAFPDLLDALFRARHEVFVEFKGWEDLRRPDGREVDAFDRDDTAYLIAVEEGRVLAGARLNGAAAETLAETILPELFEGDPLRADDVLEISRLFARPTLTLAGDLDTPLREVLIAGAEFTRLTGARGVVMIAHLHLAQAMLGWGATIEPLGLPRRTRDGILVAVMSHLSASAVRNLRKARGPDGPMLRWADGPGEPPRTIADILRIDPLHPDWTAPGDWTPLQRAALSPYELAEAYWTPRMT